MLSEFNNLFFLVKLLVHIRSSIAVMSASWFVLLHLVRSRSAAINSSCLRCLLRDALSELENLDEPKNSPMFQGASVPMRSIVPMDPLLQRCALFELRQVNDVTFDCGDRMETISAHFNSNARAPSGRWRSGAASTPTRAYFVSKVRKPYCPA